MGRAVPVRTDYTAGEVRRFAKHAKDAGQARRLLAIAAVLDGASREEAAKVGGMIARRCGTGSSASMSKGWMVWSTYRRRARHPSSTTRTGPISPGSWRKARSLRCTVWFAGGRAI